MPRALWTVGTANEEMSSSDMEGPRGREEFELEDNVEQCYVCEAGHEIVEQGAVQNIVMDSRVGQENRGTAVRDLLQSLVVLSSQCDGEGWSK